MFVRSFSTSNQDDISLQTGLHLDGEASVTQQSFKDECDINTIVRKFGVTGQLPVTALNPQYGDFTGVNDFHSALNTLIATQEVFEAVPAEIRKRFDNDPAEFVDFVTNPDNSAQLREWGFLADAPSAPPVAPVSVVQDLISPKGE